MRKIAKILILYFVCFSSVFACQKDLRDLLYSTIDLTALVNYQYYGTLTISQKQSIRDCLCGTSTLRGKSSRWYSFEWGQENQDLFYQSNEAKKCFSF